MLIFEHTISVITESLHSCGLEFYVRASLVAQTVKNLLTMQDTWV